MALLFVVSSELAFQLIILSRSYEYDSDSDSVDSENWFACLKRLIVCLFVFFLTGEDLQLSESGSDSD